MKLLATLLVVATLALYVSAQVPIPPVYTGPVQATITNAVTLQGVNDGFNNYVLQWSETSVYVNRFSQPGLFNFTRFNSMLHVAIHDTIQGFDKQYATYQSGLPAPPKKANLKAAIAGAGLEICTQYFGQYDVSEQVKYNSIFLAQIDFVRRTGVSETKIVNGYTYGAQIANLLVQSRANDGYNVIPTFIVQNANGVFRPAPPNFEEPVGNGWPAVTPWGLTNLPINNYFPATAGNTYFTNASRYITDYQEVVGKGRDTNNFAVSSIQRTGIETFIGVFWANDYFRTSLPPGQYMQIAQTAVRQVALQRGAFSQGEYARFLTLIAINIANVNIVAWGVKYTFQEWRPVVAVQAAGTDDYPETIGDTNWLPVSVTSPPFPDYISGHATFGFSLGQMIRNLVGTDNFRLSFPSDSLPEVTATYYQLSNLALDNALSRIYLGVHFRAAVLDAQQTGEAIANDVFAHQLLPL